MQANEQQAKVSLCIIETVLAIAVKHNRQAVEVATEDLQALVDELKRLSKGEC